LVNPIFGVRIQGGDYLWEERSNDKGHRNVVIDVGASYSYFLCGKSLGITIIFVHYSIVCQASIRKIKNFHISTGD
jgi:hypothetical protein